MTQTQPTLTSESLAAYVAAVIKPREHRNELNVILGGILGSTIAVLDGSATAHTKLLADSWLAWLFFDEQMNRYGFAAWSKGDRELARVLHRCATVLHEAAGDARTRHLSVAEFEALFACAYPAITPLKLKRLATDVVHQLTTVHLIVAETQAQIARIEAKKAARAKDN